MVFQGFVVQWAPAQAIFRTVDLAPREWALAAGVAASVLVYGELHRGVEALLRRWRDPAGRASPESSSPGSS